MNHAGAREVKKVAGLRQPAVRVPGPVRDGRVDPTRDEHGVDEVGQELTALGNGPAHDGRCRGREHEGEEPARVLVVVQFIVEIPGPPRHKLAALPKGQSPANGPVRHPADEGVQGVLQEDVHCVLRPDVKDFRL